MQCSLKYDHNLIIISLLDSSKQKFIILKNLSYQLHRVENSDLTSYVPLLSSDPILSKSKQKHVIN